MENPVTEALLQHCRDEIQDLELTAIPDCYVPGNPQATQENIIDLNTRRYVWDTFREVLEGDWSYFMEEDSGDSEADED